MIAAFPAREISSFLVELSLQQAQHLVPGSWLTSNRLKGQPARQLLPGRVEVLDGALAIDAGKNACRRVLDRAGNQALRPPRARADPLQVSVPEPEGQIHETAAGRPESTLPTWIVLSIRWLRKKPRSNVASPPWAHSKSSRIKPPECTRIFLGLKSPRTSVRSCGGTSIAAISASILGSDRRMGPGDRAIVRVEPQLIEQRRVGERSPQFRMIRCLGVNGPQDGAQAAGNLRVRLAVHEVGLPGLGIVRHAGHGEQVVGAILEMNPGNRAGRQQCPSTSSAARSAQMRSSRAPVHGHPQTVAALLDHEGGPVFQVNSQDDIRDPAGQFAHPDQLTRGNLARILEVRGGVFPGQFPHGRVAVMSKRRGSGWHLLDLINSNQGFQQEPELANLDLAFKGVVRAIDDGETVSARL